MQELRAQFAQRELALLEPFEVLGVVAVLAQRHRLGGVPFLLQTFGPYVQELGEGRHGGLRSAISAAPEFPRPLTRAVYPEVEVVLLVPGQPRPARLLFFRCPLFGACACSSRQLPGRSLARFYGAVYAVKSILR